MATNGGSINYTVKYNIDKTGLNQMKASLQEIFNLSKQDLGKLIELLKVNDTSMNVSQMYLYYLLNEYNSIDKSKIDKLINKKHLSIEQAYYQSFLDVLELDSQDPDYQYANKVCKVSNIKKLDPNKYLSNPYYQNIKVPETKIGKWNFQYDSYLPYEGFMYKDIIIDPNNFAEQSQLGFFEKPFKYLTIAQKNNIWMCITPHEIETMDQSIKEASGNVAVFGLGLGYYPYMISRKDDVKKITIIEKDINAINLFNQYILPQFEFKDKIEVVQADAFKYAKEMSSDKINYAFVDLWHNVDDGLPLYLQMKAIEHNIKNITFSYWIEDSLIAYLRRSLFTLIDEQADGSNEENYQHAENFNDKLINKMFYVYKDTIINSYQDIINILSKDNLLSKMHLFF